MAEEAKKSVAKGAKIGKPKKAECITEDVSIPDGIKVDVKGAVITIGGPKGAITKTFKHPLVRFEFKGKQFIITSRTERRKEKAVVRTWAAHLNNMIVGTTKGFEYKMKAVYAHFPIKTSVKGPAFVIENFIGERSPRKAKVIGKTTIKIAGDSITISGINVEDVGQTMANIERATRIKGFDRRTFQDGIYLIERG